MTRPLSLATRRTSGAVLALIAAALAFGLAAAAYGQALDEYVRFEVPDGLDIASLVGNPTVLAAEHRSFQDQATGERRSDGFSDIAAVYDIPLEALLRAASDFAAYSRFMPRIIESSPIELGALSARVPTASTAGPVRLVYASGIKLLGIEVVYRIIGESSVETLGGGAFGTRARMVESLDGKLYKQANSFYFAPVVVRGKTMTFVRYYSTLGIRNPGAATVKVLSVAVGTEGKAQVKALASEALRRASSEATGGGKGGLGG